MSFPSEASEGMNDEGAAVSGRTGAFSAMVEAIMGDWLQSNLES